MRHLRLFLDMLRPRGSVLRVVSRKYVLRRREIFCGLPCVAVGHPHGAMSFGNQER